MDGSVRDGNAEGAVLGTETGPDGRDPGRGSERRGARGTRGGGLGEGPPPARGASADGPSGSAAPGLGLAGGPRSSGTLVGFVCLVLRPGAV